MFERVWPPGPTLLRLLEKLLSLPTAPFHERFVSSLLCAELKAAGIDFSLDQYGNIIATDGGSECLLACVAHMDHPGFEIVHTTATMAGR